MAAKLQVYDEVVLECSQPWLEAPGALILPHNGRMFEVKVHLFALPLHIPPIPLTTWPRILQPDLVTLNKVTLGESCCKPHAV